MSSEKSTVADRFAELKERMLANRRAELGRALRRSEVSELNRKAWQLASQGDGQGDLHTPANDGDMALWSELAVLVLGRRAKPVEEVRWVADHIMIPIEDIDVNDIPSACCLAWLKDVQTDREARKAFWNGPFKALLPNRNQADAGETFVDDNRKLEGLEDKVLRAMGLDSDDVVDDEPELPAIEKML